MSDDICASITVEVSNIVDDDGRSEKGKCCY